MRFVTRLAEPPGIFRHHESTFKLTVSQADDVALRIPKAKVDRMHGKNLTRKPDLLLVLAVVVVLGALMSTTVQAAEPFQFKPQSRLAKLTADFDENSYRLTGFGKTNAGLHISMSPPAAAEESYLDNGGSERGMNNQSDVFLSIRLPW